MRRFLVVLTLALSLTIGCSKKSTDRTGDEDDSGNQTRKFNEKADAFSSRLFGSWVSNCSSIGDGTSLIESLSFTQNGLEKIFTKRITSFSDFSCTRESGVSIWQYTYAVESLSESDKNRASLLIVPLHENESASELYVVLQNDGLFANSLMHFRR